jgi:hypothetical protein
MLHHWPNDDISPIDTCDVNYYPVLLPIVDDAPGVTGVRLIAVQIPLIDDTAHRSKALDFFLFSLGPFATLGRESTHIGVTRTRSVGSHCAQSRQKSLSGVCAVSVERTITLSRPQRTIRHSMGIPRARRGVAGCCGKGGVSNVRSPPNPNLRKLRCGKTEAPSAGGHGARGRAAGSLETTRP